MAAHMTIAAALVFDMMHKLAFTSGKAILYLHIDSYYLKVHL
jgi:hypothetical protein